MGLIKHKKGIFANIISDGSIRVKSSETDPEAVRRDYKLSDGTEGFKYEQVFEEISGIITGISFRDGKYGKSLVVYVKDEEEINLSMSYASNYADDLMKKLPNIDFNKKVIIKPYSFEDKGGKLRKGITVYQDGEKIESFFHDEEKKPLHGFPVQEKAFKDCDSDDWKIYFLTTKKFLQNYLETNTSLVRQYQEEEPESEESDNSGTIIEGINVEEIDFSLPAKETVPVQTTIEPPFESPKKETPEALEVLKLGQIRELARTKLGADITNEARWQIAVMQKLNLPIIPANYDQIIEKLKV